jgi:hypothetical protein
MGVPEHDVDSVSVPEQPLLRVRVRSLVPDPHVVEQAPQSDQVFQVPCMAELELDVPHELPPHEGEGLLHDR